MIVTSANRYLTRAEMEGNAEFIFSVFHHGNGWTMNAVCAMLGNMESESGINPGIYENLDSTSTTNGFGLVQWTPNTKYKEWADANGYGSNYGDIVGQVARIKYEVENGLQWIPTSKYNLTFTDFTQSNRSVEELAQAFMYNYERPANLDHPERSTQARAWYNYFINAGETPEPPPAAQNKPISKLLMYYTAIKRR